MSEFNIEHKKSLDKEKLVDRILVCVLIVFCIVLTVMGVDIEKKLSKLNETPPVTSIAQTSSNLSNDYYYSTNPATTEALSVQQQTDLSVPSSETSTGATSAVITDTTSTYNETIASDITTGTTVSTAQSISQPSQPVVQSSAQSATTEARISDGKYYVTASGKKYHLSFCTYLNKTKIEISLEDALSKGYEPCSRCID